MQKLIFLALICFFISCSSYKKVPKQSISILENAANLDTISPIEFDKLIFSAYKSYKESDLTQEPLEIKEAVIRKLHKGYFVSDSAILISIYAYALYESYKFNLLSFETDSFYFSYKKAIGTIDQIVSLLYQRNDLMVKLLHLKALYGQSDPNEDQGIAKLTMDTYKNAIHLSDSLSAQALKDNLFMKVELARLYRWHSKDIEKAKDLYKEVLSYPFYLTTDKSLFYSLRENYIWAGDGLLECNKGDLKALQNMFFIPSAAEDLDRKKLAYIKELGGRIEPEEQQSIEQQGIKIKIKD
jgi:hypothetical protein